MSENLYANITGWLSIASWIVVFTTQIYQNFKGKSGESLSLWFLWIWLLGDVFNIAGIALENLLPTMLFLAVYYTIADMILIMQVFYYRRLHRSDSMREEFDRLLEEHPRTPDGEVRNLETADEDTTCCLNPKFILTWTSVSLSFILYTVGMVKYLGVAQYMGWSSALLYIGSRIPQIRKNTRKQSTQGLSLYMFLFGIAGNSLYCASIFLQSTDKDYLMTNMPWLIGAGGTLFLDVFIGIQFLLYKSSTEEQNEQS
jgi:uncharacterized protein with PQ loop repeat